MNDHESAANAALNEYYLFKSRQKKKLLFEIIISLSLVVIAIIIALSVFAIKGNNQKSYVEEEINDLNDESTVSDVVAVFGSYYELSDGAKKKVQNYETLEEKITAFDLNADTLGTMWENLKFVKSDDGYSIKAKNKDISGKLIIPSSYKGLSVINVAEKGFCMTELESVIISNSISTIETQAFFCCKNISKVIIPNSVTYIGESAFSGCDSIEELTVNGNNTSIATWAFQSCTSLKRIQLYGVIKIDEQAFNGCKELNTILIDNKIEQIDLAVFNNCTKLNTIYYVGTSDEWKEINIDSRGNFVANNDCLFEATRYYYSENQPTEKGNYWHYVNDVATPW